jgi:hypothetical protein
MTNRLAGVATMLAGVILLILTAPPLVRQHPWLASLAGAFIVFGWDPTTAALKRWRHRRDVGAIWRS